MQRFLDILEKVANDKTLPGRINQWACDMYDSIVWDKEESLIKISDLVIIENLIEDYPQGLYLLDHKLVCES